MKPSIFVGIVIAALIGAGAVFAPVLRSSEAKNTAQALMEAELARRLLSDAVTRVADLVMASELAAIKSAQLKPLADATDISEEKAREAIKGLENRIAEDSKLIADAAAAIADADGHGVDLRAVKQVAGMVNYHQAMLALAEASRFRKQAATQSDAMLRVGAGLNFAQSSVDQWRALDVSEVVSSLQASVDKATSAESEARSEAEEISAQVAQRVREIEDVRTKLAAVRAELLSHESVGFTAGDDESFGSYRQTRLALDQALRDHQAQEQMLRFGGIRGASFDAEDLTTAGISGGEPVLALSELKWRLDDANRSADGYRASRELAVKNIESMNAIAAAAGDKRADYESRITKLRAQLDEILKQQAALLKSAHDKEGEALTAARKARDAFSAADAAAAKWVSAASRMRSELDPDHLNDRLEKISTDPYVKRIGLSSKGAALLLIARIHAQRIAELERMLAARAQFAEYVPGVDFGSTETIDNIIKTGREDGTNSLKDAVTIFEKLATGAGNTAWVPQTALSAAQYLLSKIDAPNADQHFSDALLTVEEAVRGQDHSPYLVAFVRFRNHLKSIADAKAGDAIDTGEFGEED